mgnify:CR=1 FL=1
MGRKLIRAHEAQQAQMSAFLAIRAPEYHRRRRGNADVFLQLLVGLVVFIAKIYQAASI